MEVKEFTFRLMLLGFPGICCYFLLKKLIGKIGSDITEAVLSIFVLSLFCYFTTDLFFFLPRYVPCLPWSRPAIDFNLVKSLFGNNGQIGARLVLLTTVISAPVVAGALSFLYRHKVWNRACQKIGLTHRFGDEDLFNFILDAKQKPEWYVVRDHKENLIYYGAITHCSDEGTDRELLLAQVDVYSNEGDATHLYSCPSLYVCRKRDDISIEVAVAKSPEPTEDTK